MAKALQPVGIEDSTAGSSDEEKIYGLEIEASCYGNQGYEDLTPAYTGLPELYREKMNEEGLTKYWSMVEDILEESKSMVEVTANWVEIITSKIAPAGWLAVWKAEAWTDLTCEAYVLVQVNDVSRVVLKATVTCLKVFHPLYLELPSKPLEVALIDLYPLVDAEGQYERTAQLLNHLRIFYLYLWRPWDEEDNEGEVMLDLPNFEKRFQLYVEFKKQTLPENLSRKYRKLIRRNKIIRENMAIFNDYMEDVINPDIPKYLQYLELRTEYEISKNSFIWMEDPLMRLHGRDRKKIEVKEHAWYVVSREFTLSQLRDLPMYDSTPLRFCTDLGRALGKVASAGKVIVAPEEYCVETTIWIEDCVTVCGGHEPYSSLIADILGDVFINVHSLGWVVFKNLNFYSYEGLSHLFVHHRGRLDFCACKIDARNCKNAIHIVKGSSLCLDRSLIKNALECAVKVTAPCTIILSATTIANCPVGISLPNVHPNRGTLSLRSVCFYKTPRNIEFEDDTIQGEATRTTQGEATRTTKDEATRTTQDGVEHILQGEATRTTQDGVEHTLQGEATRTTQDGVEHILQGEATRTTQDEATRTTQGEAENTNQGGAENTTKGEAENTTEGEAENTTEGEAENTTEGEAENTTQGEAENTTEGEAENTTQGEAIRSTQGERGHTKFGWDVIYEK